jgi:hypothetical protein
MYKVQIIALIHSYSVYSKYVQLWWAERRAGTAVAHKPKNSMKSSVRGKKLKYLKFTSIYYVNVSFTFKVPKDCKRLLYSSIVQVGSV